MKQLKLILIAIIITSCTKNDDLDISEYVDHWEINRTYETHNNSKLNIDTLENEYRIESGLNQVLILSVEKKPIFKEGKNISDLYSTESLLIELDIADHLVSTSKPANSKLYRKTIAFSPDYGINLLGPNEKLVFTRKDSTVWKITSEIYDFEFNAELGFDKKQVITTKFHDY